MKKKFFLFVLTLLTVACVSAKDVQATIDPRVEGFMQLDKNGDGVLSEAEAPAGMFSLLDANGDGWVERSEVVALLSAAKVFSWINPPPKDRAFDGLVHATLQSKLMDTEVGYNIYLPQGYYETANRTRYPVIYYLHGGRPGNESRSIGLVKYIDAAIQAGAIHPLIFVWVNGGEVSHYNHGNSKGEDVFIKELIPHIDKTYRTLAHRGGRAIQGFSQGGRGTTRIMFKYPELFISAAPGGAGYAVEKQIAENGGVEKDMRAGADAKALDFGEGNDAYSLAREYAGNSAAPTLEIMTWVGNKGFNYEATLEYLGFLYGLGIPAQRLVADGVDHNPMAFYEVHGEALLQFHDKHWQREEE